MIGRQFGDFVIKEAIGGGGSGDVYRAEQLSLGREAVIKVLRTFDDGERPATADGANADRFLREARLASQLDHPFAAHVYGFGSEPDGTLWIAMELVRGVSLQALIKTQGPVRLRRFVPFFDRLCEVLHAAHEQGIIHRDIKPHNVMVLNRAGRLLPKLLDLGIARRGAAPVELAGGEALDASHALSGPESLSITQKGTIVGTPHYMAPEQWANASEVDARADLYSMTFLAYQALVGKSPFDDAETVFALARAHAKHALPKVPDGLPSQLDEVFAKGAAKKPEDRYQNALALASALRVASGVAVEPLSLPELDHALQETILADAPQPIAEATALIEASRTAHQQLDAILTTRRVLVRYLAAIALAARARVGPGSSRDAPEVVTLVERLSLDRLTDGEWTTLAAQLCAPFALRRDAHPIPELVEFFAGDGARALAAFDAVVLPPAEAKDDVLHAALVALLPALALLLQRASFLNDYPLVVYRSDCELWMGTRRATPRQQRVASSLPAPGEAFLVDSLDEPVLSLAPIVQVFPPSGGMHDELFFVDGAGRFGARLLALPGQFERQRDDVWPWLSQHIVDVARAQAQAVDTEKPPYKGLSTFTRDDADNYFGREQEAESFANRLRLSKFLVVVGPSGAGKSSFILAGVLPLLEKSIVAVVMRPGATPLVELEAKLGAKNGDLLLVVDQLEELVTLCMDVAMREAFAVKLRALSSLPNVRVVCTLRDDFLMKIQQLEPLREQLSSSLQLLATPAAADLVRVVIEPARRIGYTFDDVELPMKMVAAVVEYPGALALLSFTAAQIWELRDRQLKQMRAKTYAAIGGVGGALGHHAEVTLAAMTDAETALVREAFRHLVTAQNTRAVLSRREFLDVLGDSLAARSLLEKLIIARLLVTSEDASGVDRVEIIHEALISSWPRLSSWLHEDAESARLLGALRASARQWDERQRPVGLLWRRETLTEYKVWRARYQGRLTRVEEAFADASLHDEARGKRVRQGLSIAAVLTLVVGLVVIFGAYREATDRFLALRQEQGRLALLDEKPLEALAYMDDAARRGADNADLRLQAGIAAYLLSGFKSDLALHKQSIASCARSSDGSLLASFSDDSTVSIVDVAHPDRAWRVESETPCTRGDFSPDGRTLVAVCGGSKLVVFDVANMRRSATWDVGSHEARSVSVTSRGTAVVGLGGVGAAEINLHTGKSREFGLGAQLRCCGVQRSALGDRVAVFAGPMPDEPDLHGVVLLDATQQPLSVPLDSIVRAATFSPNGELLAVGTIMGDVGVWSIAQRKWLWKVNRHQEKVRSVVFSPAGDMLFSSSAANVVGWNLKGESVWSVLTREPIVNLAVTSDGLRLGAAGMDPALHVFEASTGVLQWRHFGHVGATVDLVAMRDGTFVSAGVDGLVKQWDSATSRMQPVPLAGELKDAHFVRDGLVITTTSGVVREKVDGSREVLLSQTFPADAAVNVRYGKATHLLVRGESVDEYDANNQVLAHTTAPAQANLIYQFRGSLALQDTDGSVTIAATDGTRRHRLDTGSEKVGSVLFVDASTLATCGVAGSLAIWSVASGERLFQTKAHANYCELQQDADVLTSRAIDASLRKWTWDGRTLLAREETVLPSHAMAIMPNAPVNFVSDPGEWVQLSSQGLPIAKLALTKGGALEASADRGAYWLIDPLFRFRRFVVPTSILMSELITLQSTRGRYSVEYGYLAVKNKNRQNIQLRKSISRLK